MVQRILVLCTGNSCRSIMAEAILNHLGRGRVSAFSAGSHPAGYVHPEALRTLKRHGIEAEAAYSKSWDVYAGQSFDVVITVCDSAAAESCPLFSGSFTKQHWSTPDPAKATGTAAQIQAAFDGAFALLEGRIREWLGHA